MPNHCGKAACAAIDAQFDLAMDSLPVDSALHDVDFACLPFNPFSAIWGVCTSTRSAVRFASGKRNFPFRFPPSIRSQALH